MAVSSAKVARVVLLDCGKTVKKELIIYRNI